MAIGGWNVESMIRFATNGPEVMAQLDRATQAANVTLARQLGFINSQEAALLRYSNTIQGIESRREALASRTTAALERERVEQQRLNYAIEQQLALEQRTASRTYMRGLGTAQHVGGALALGGALTMGAGTWGAAQMQLSMTQVANALNMQLSQMAPFYSLAFKVSGMTAQSSKVITDELAIAASAGLNDPKKLVDAFPRIAKAADVLFLGPKHLDPVESVKEMSTLAHLFGQYSGPGLQHILDRAVQMQYVQPEGLSSLITQGRLFIPAALSRGVSEDDIFEQAVAMGQTGQLRSRGGSGLARFIEYLGGAATVTGHLSARQHGAMHALGLTDSSGKLLSDYVDKHGNLLLEKAVDHLEKISKNFTPTEFGNLLTNAFLAQGGRYVAAILRPAVYEKLQQNVHQMNAIGGVDKLWGKDAQTFFFAWNEFITNFDNIFKATFLPVLPRLTDGLKAVAKWLGSIAASLYEHPIRAEVAAGIIAFATALGGVVWATATFLLARAAIQIPANVAAIADSMQVLSGALAGDSVAISTSAKVATTGLGSLGGALARFAALFGAGTAVAAVVGVLYGAYYNAKHFPHQPADAGGLLNHGITPSGVHYSQDVDVFGRVIPHPSHATMPHAKGHSGGVHVEKVEVHIHDAHDPKKVAAAVFDVLRNPRHIMRAAAAATRTHPFIPNPLSVGTTA